MEWVKFRLHPTRFVIPAAGEVNLTAAAVLLSLFSPKQSWAYFHLFI